MAIRKKYYPLIDEIITKLSFVGLVFFLTLQSCEKEKLLYDENSDPDLLYQVIYGDELYVEYTYNDAKLPLEEKNKFHYSKNNYNDHEQLISSDYYWDVSMASSDSRIAEAAMNRKEWVNPLNTPKSLIHRYEYDGDGKMIRKAYYRLSDNFPDIVEFLYEDGKIFRSVNYYNNIKSGYTDYFYDDRGNLVRQDKYSTSGSGDAEIISTTEYEFDDMMNPYYVFRNQGAPGKFTNPNNIIKETTTLHFETDPMVQKVQVVVSSYKYNIRGYPIILNDGIRFVYGQE